MYEVTDPQNGLADIWTFDLVRRVPSRLTFEPESEVYPIWSPDDQTVVYSVLQPNGAFDLYRKTSTGAGAPERVYTSGALKFPIVYLVMLSLGYLLVTKGRIAQRLSQISTPS